MYSKATLLGALLLSAALNGGHALAAPQPQSLAQSSDIVKGIVVDAAGEPVIGASVMEQGTTRGTVTDINGRFELDAAANATLRISYIGYKTVDVAAAPAMKVVLEDDNALLDELVVVGYGQQKKVNLTGAVANIDLDRTLASRPELDVAKALQGAVPGLTVVNSNGDIDSQPNVRIRGLGTLSNGQSSSPLIVVDGVPTDDLSMINANDIASISVLKDAASSSIYGSRAAFGVILITTKHADKGDRVQLKYNGYFAWDQATILPDFPDVPTQLTAALRAKARKGNGSVELFGMYFDKLLPYAQKWKEQNGGTKKGYGQMNAYADDGNVGDYRFIDGQPYYYADYDIRGIWYDSAAPSTSHDVSLSGSSGKTSYYVGFGYNYKQDVMKISPAKLNRYNLTANLRTDLTDWLTFGLRANFTRRDINRANPFSNIYQYIWRWGSFFVPSGYVVADDGTACDYRLLALQKQAARTATVHDMVRMNAYAVAHITKDLTLNVDYTYQVDNTNLKSSANSVYGMNWTGTTPTWLVQPSTTNATRDNTKANRWVANAYASYSHTWNKAHNLAVMAGVNGESYSSDYFYVRRTQLYDESYPELNMAYGDLSQATVNSSAADRATAGYFGRVNYDYRGIYLLELNGRYDGSSRFPAGHKWAFFPSFSVGYRFTEDGYWKNLHRYVGNGKLRFSYGEIGNEAVGDNMFLSTISQVNPGSTYWLDGSDARVNQLDMPTWVGPSLTWERIRTTDLGLDLSFLNDELTVTIDCYQRLTNDMLAPGKALPGSVGSAAPYTNAGQLRTRGWEVSVGWHRQLNKDLGLYASFNIGDSKSKITKWNNDSKIIGHTGGIDTDYNAKMYAYEGETWGDIWGFETDRYFTVDDFNGQNADGSWIYKDGVADQTGIQTDNFVYGPGDIKFKDLNGDGKIDGGDGTLENHGDLKVIGNTMPRYEYSFHTGGSFRGFDLDLFFQGVGKRSMWTQSSFAFPEMREPDLAIYSNQTSYNVYDPDNGVVDISEKNDYPCLYPGNEYAGNVAALAPIGGCHNYYPQTKYLADLSYLRLKSVTLGYTLPPALTRKAHLSKVRLYASVNNLCLLHNGARNLPIDPEMNDGPSGTYGYGTWGRTYPITRSWSVGLQVDF